MQSFQLTWNRKQSYLTATYNGCLVTDDILDEPFEKDEYYGNDNTEIEVFPNYRVYCSSPNHSSIRDVLETIEYHYSKKMNPDNHEDVVCVYKKISINIENSSERKFMVARFERKHLALRDLFVENSVFDGHLTLKHVDMGYNLWSFYCC